MKSNQLDLVQYFNQNDGHGNGLIIKGKVRIGKTYLLGIITKIFIDNGFYILTNVRFEDWEFEKHKDKMTYVIDDIDFFEAFCEIPKNSKLIIMWDDAQSKPYMTSKAVMTPEGKKLASFLIFIGKFECNYVYVAHQKYIPHAITEGFNPLVIYKFKRESFLISNKVYEYDYDVYSDSESVFVPVPKTDQFKGLDIKSVAVADFKFRLDLDSLYTHLAKYEYGEDLRRGVRDFLNSDSAILSKSSELKSYTYVDIALSIYLKRGLIKDSTPLNQIINPNTLSEAKRKYKKL